jgi:hypothetical protein
MYFSYGRRKRPGVTAPTTFEAVSRGERTSTTRFASWRGHARWLALRPGDMVRFFEDREMRGRSLLVRVRSVERVDMAELGARLDEWSAAEGWLPEVAAGLAERHGREAAWVRYSLFERAPDPGQGTFAFQAPG